jgi:hypothetical protein
MQAFYMPTHSEQFQEQKKMRKQRREAERQDKTDRIRMGLIPPDPPKGLFDLGCFAFRS